MALILGTYMELHGTVIWQLIICDAYCAAKTSLAQSFSIMKLLRIYDVKLVRPSIKQQIDIREYPTKNLIFEKTP